MWRKASIRISLIGVLLLLASAVYAQGAEPQDSDPHWQAAYWNNISLSGTPTREETVDQINYDWGYSSPHHTVATEGFSARWRRYLDLPADSYRFTATADDGMRVYVDGRLIIDQWREQPAQTYVADVTLRAGHHLVVVEYYEMTGAAVAKLSWAPVSTQTGVWRGQYYSNRSLSGAPLLTRQDTEIAFNWGVGAPAAGLPSDNFSVRWTATVPLQAGSYRFTTTSDDGVRVTVDARTILDAWHDQPPRSYSAELVLTGGPHEIVVEYYEHTGGATARFGWTLLSPGLGEWQGEYFDNPTLGGSPVLTRADENIDFNWGTGSPAAGLPSERFSIRWTRTVRLERPLPLYDDDRRRRAPVGQRAPIDRRVVRPGIRDAPGRDSRVRRRADRDALLRERRRGGGPDELDAHRRRANAGTGRGCRGGWRRGVQAGRRARVLARDQRRPRRAVHLDAQQRSLAPPLQLCALVSRPGAGPL